MNVTLTRMIKVARAHGCTRLPNHPTDSARVMSGDGVTLRLCEGWRFRMTYRTRHGKRDTFGYGVVELCDAFVVAWREMGR